MTGGRDRTALEVVDGVDLSGREAVVTGGSGGIGFETARALAAAGARVVIAGRNRTCPTRWTPGAPTACGRFRNGS